VIVKAKSDVCSGVIADRSISAATENWDVSTSVTLISVNSREGGVWGSVGLGESTVEDISLLLVVGDESGKELFVFVLVSVGEDCSPVALLKQPATRTIPAVVIISRLFIIINFFEAT
jgi:hypothetical protein